MLHVLMVEIRGGAVALFGLVIPVKPQRNHLSEPKIKGTKDVRFGRWLRNEVAHKVEK